MNSTKHKKPVNPLVLIAWLWLVFLLAFVVTVLLVLAKDPVSFAIFLQQQQVPQGQAAVLTYRVSNAWPNDITNVTVSAKVQQESGLEQVFNIESVEIFHPVIGQYVVNTALLSPGNYTAEVELRYLKPERTSQPKILSLSFQVL